MTERQPSASQRLESKVDKLEDKFDVMTVSLFSMQGDIKAILERLDMQPKIDDRRFTELERSEVNCKNQYDKRFDKVEKDVSEIKDKPSKRWDLIIAVIITTGINQFIAFLTK